MGLFLKKTTVVGAILLAVPVAAIFTNWQWQPESANTISYYLLQITKTAGKPCAYVVFGLLFLLFCFLLPVKRISKIILLGVILFLAFGAGELIKSEIKTTTQEPRPYVVWMEQHLSIDHNYFYSLPKPERQEIVATEFSKFSTVPAWLSQYLQSETNYSLPSGHTLFATLWAFLAVFILGLKRHPIAVSLIVAWAVVIEVSRLVLGMHHPVDLILAIIIAWIIAAIAYICIKKGVLS